jgi:hypothetical protein
MCPLPGKYLRVQETAFKAAFTRQIALQPVEDAKMLSAFNEAGPFKSISYGEMKRHLRIAAAALL